MFKNGFYIVTTSVPLYVNDEVFLVNENCEFEYDSAYGCFNKCQFTYEVELDIIEQDLSEYIKEKSNNGGAYAYATGIAKKITLLGE